MMNVMLPTLGATYFIGCDSRTTPSNDNFDDDDDNFVDFREDIKDDSDGIAANIYMMTMTIFIMMINQGYMYLLGQYSGFSRTVGLMPYSRGVGAGSGSSGLSSE